LYRPIQILFVSHKEHTFSFPKMKWSWPTSYHSPLCPTDVHRHYFTSTLCKRYKLIVMHDSYRCLWVKATKRSAALKS